MVLMWASLGYVAGMATVLVLLWVRRRVAGWVTTLLARVRNPVGLRLPRPVRLRRRATVLRRSRATVLAGRDHAGRAAAGEWQEVSAAWAGRRPGDQEPGLDGATEYLAPTGGRLNDATEYLPAAQAQPGETARENTEENTGENIADLPTEAPAVESPGIKGPVAKTPSSETLSSETEVLAFRVDDPTVRLPAVPATQTGADALLGLTDAEFGRASLVDGPLPPAPGEPTVAPSLAWLRGERDYLLSRATTAIGRSSTCDIVLDYDLVSRRHCVIRNDGQDWWLEPLETQNGTLLNDRPLPAQQPVRLRSGDRIGLGGATEFTLVVPQSERAGPQLVFRAFGRSMVGGRRSNEDVYHFDAEMIAVADGVGGRPAGGLAAQLAVDGVRNAGPGQDLMRTVQETNSAIRARGEEDVMATGLATTLDVAILRKRWRGYRVEGLHIGDGTVLLQEGTKPVSLVRAHSSGNLPVLAGRGTGHPGEGRLLRAVGLAEKVEPDHWERPAERGQRYVLASDGLVNALGPARLHSALAQLRPRHPQECVRHLLDLAEQADATDNVTVVVADVIPTEEE